MTSSIDRALAITSYFFAFFWGIFILLSFIGWGGLINRLLFPKDRVDWGQRAAWGVALTICVGGVLNLTSTISPITICIYLGLGFLYYLVNFYQQKLLTKFFYRWHEYSKDRLLVLGVFVLSLLLLLQYAGWVYTYRFHPEDYSAYLVFPKKMLMAGSLGEDPFSGRKILSSLGGQYFLFTLPLSILKEVHVKLIDPGVALIIIVGLLLGYSNRKKLSKRMTVFLIFTFLLFPHPQTYLMTNITTGLMPIVLFLTLFMTLDWENLKSSKFTTNALIIALITAAICSVKSNLIPAVGLFFIASYTCYILTANKDKKIIAITEFITSSLIILILLAPWMISMYQSSGTFLYPILGKGYHITAYSDYNLFSSKWTITKFLEIIVSTITMTSFVALIILSLVSFCSRNWQIVDREPVLCLTISASLGSIIMALSTGGGDIDRYTFSYLYATLFILIINACAFSESVPKKSFSKIPVAMILVGTIIGGNLINEFSRKNNIGNIRVGLSNMPLVSNKEKKQYTQMQEAIPQSEKILTRLEKPFLLNFGRNQVFIVDLPGEAGPPPGLPIFKGGEALAAYLTSHSIRYVAYAYANEAGYPKKLVQERLKEKWVNEWVRSTSKLTFDFQDSLKELGQSRQRVYDDGEIFVIDLLRYEVKNK
jgi:hypothetical protein